VILPLSTESLLERLQARDISERIAATLSRTSVASVVLADQSRTLSTQAPRPRNAGAEYCLLGRLTQRGDRVRVIIRLVDVLADRHVWGDSFDGSADDPFDLEARVVDGVQCGVVSKILDAEIARVSNKAPNDLAVCDMAMQALPHILAADVPSAGKAITILKRAIELDPACALAVALLAWGQAQLGNYYGTASPSAAREQATQLAHRAGVLDERDPLVTLARSACGGRACDARARHGPHVFMGVGSPRIRPAQQRGRSGARHWGFWAGPEVARTIVASWKQLRWHRQRACCSRSAGAGCALATQGTG
jgi:TolB-like protein